MKVFDGNKIGGCSSRPPRSNAVRLCSFAEIVVRESGVRLPHDLISYLSVSRGMTGGERPAF